MAAVSKAAVDKQIQKLRSEGLGDQQIMIKLLKRKDAIGQNLQKALDRAQDNGSQSPLEDVGGLFGLNPTRAAGSRTAGEVNKNPTFKQGLTASAQSVGMALADVGGDVVKANKSFGDGVNKLVNKVAGTKLDTTAADRYKAEVKKANDSLEVARSQAGRKGTDLTRLGTEVVATLPFYMAGGGGTMVARSGQQALIGGSLGAARYSENNAEKVANIAGGAIGGAVGQAGGEVLGKGIAKAVTKASNAKNGRLAPAAQVVEDLGKLHGVRTTAGDSGRGAITKKIDAGLERVPVVGTAGFRKAQHGEAKAAATKVTGALKDVMSETDYKALPKLQAAANGGDRDAARVLNIVENAGDDAGRVLQAGAEMRAWREGQVAKKLYDKVGEEVDKLPSAIVTPSQTDDIIARKLEEQAKSLKPNNELIKELDDISTRLADPEVSKDFANMRQLRSRLGELADQYGMDDKALSKAFADVKQAVDDDIAAFVANSGNPAIKQAYKKADNFYRTIMSRKDKALANAMKSDKPDEIYDAFVRANKGDRAANFYRNLDPKAQAALRYSMAERAMDKAVNPSTKNFSPANFAREFERMSEPYSNVFKGDDKKQMDGLVKLMRHVERAGQYMENPSTGNRLVEYGMAGTALTAPPLAVKAVGASVIAKWLLTSKAGKNMLLAADKLPPEKAAALDNILKSAAKMAAAAGAKTGQKTAERVAGAKVSEEDKKALSSF